MNIDVFNPYAQKEATEFHVKIITDCCEAMGCQINKIEAIRGHKNNREKGIIVIAAKDVIKAKLCGYKFILLRNGGISPEESFMRHHSYPRYYVLSIIEMIGLCLADFRVFVSECMLNHYARKYKIKKDNCYVMPCFNDEIKREFFYSNKYKNNVFIYAGSLSVWQCFEKTVEVYKQIEEQVEDAFFRVLVKDAEGAKRVLEKHHVRNYSIDYVPVNVIAEEMRKAKFGFCLRENEKVNQVATPTKLSNYVSNGVIPIYSKYLGDFEKIAKNSKYCISVDNEKINIDKIVEFCRKDIMEEDIYEDFKECFGMYYSKEHHLERLSEIFVPLIKKYNKGSKIINM